MTKQTETITYVAHIVTAEAAALGEPEIIITTQETAHSQAEQIAWYPIPDDQHVVDVLTGNGWRATSTARVVAPGITMLYVTPNDPVQIVRDVTARRTQAAAEHRRLCTAWRTLVHDAMNAGVSATRLAEAAGVSRERVYQVKYGR